MTLSIVSPPTVPALWGDATRRSLQFFAIGATRMPLALVHAMAHIKRAAAEVNANLGILDRPRARAIAEAAQAVADGHHDAQFPLCVWQTGSGTQSHMNVNEVIAALANQDHPEAPVDAHDDVNRAQSSNDVFPSAVHIAAALAVRDGSTLHDAALAMGMAAPAALADWLDPQRFLSPQTD
jgi:fumarate hydratase class II